LREPTEVPATRSGTLSCSDSAEARAAAEHIADRWGKFGDRGHSQPTRLKYQRSTTTVMAMMAIASG